MMTRYLCALNGIPLHGLDASIHVTDITELPPAQRIQTAARPGHGLHLLSRVRERLTVRVSCIVQEYDVVRRREVLQKLRAWANPGGVLTTNDHPGQQLTVECTGLPTESAQSWLDELTFDFTAYAVPFWEAAEATAVTTDSSGTLALPGSAEAAPVDVTLINKGTALLYSVTLTVGDTSMTFSALNLAAGATLTLTVEADCLRATVGGVSVLSCRTEESDDLLLARCGAENAVSIQAAQPVSATFSARGRYL